MAVSRPSVALGALLALVLLLAGCTGSEGDAGSDATPETSGAAPSPSASATPVVEVPPAPPRDACYRVTGGELTRPSNSDRPVACTSPHTARTIAVGDLATVLPRRAARADSAAVQRRLAQVCGRRLAAFLGGSQQDRDLSRLAVVWYSPTATESDRGADWFRCDVVAFAGTASLLPLPRRSPGLRGVLDRPGALDTYGLCGSAAPGTRGFRRVACGRPHAWRAIATVAHPRRSRLPGPARGAQRRRRHLQGAGRGAGRRRADLPLGLGVAHPGAVALRSALRLLLGARLTRTSGSPGG